LDRALPEDRQHPELVAIVEHRGHVGTHDRHRAADRRRDHRDRAGIEKIALGEFVALSRGALLRTGGACEQSPKHANGNTQDRAHEIPHSNFVFSNNYGKAKRQMMAELRIATPRNMRVSRGQHD
jgi:hypothetical protein